MKNLPIPTVFAAFIASVATPATASAQGLPENFEAQIETLMADEEVVGLAVAVIDRGQVVHVSAHGYRNRENALPLQIDTIMYGASLTKTVSAYVVSQMADEGLVDLDRPIVDVLDRPLPEYEDWTDLADDAQWRDLTPRLLLSHQSGLANLRWLEEDGHLRFHRSPGTRYGYSGEGYYILQTMLEEGLGLDFKAEAQTRVFDRFGMSNSSLQWRADFAGNLADGYAMDGSFEPHDERSWVSASGSMDTTIADQAQFWAGLMRGDGLSEDARAEMVTAQIAIDSPSQFPSLIEGTDSRGAEIGLAAGLGLTVYHDATGHYFSKGGHNPWTGNMVVCREEDQRCVVLMANSVRAELIYPQIVEIVMGETPVPWWWIYPEQDTGDSD